MKTLVLPIAVVVMIGVIGAAFALDCIRLAADARGRVGLADDEMYKHELRLVTVLSGSARVSPEVQTAITKHQQAKSPRARHEAYEQLVARFRQTMSEAVDPTNPLDRKFMDDIAGAINRREVAQKQYDEEFAAYKHYDDSLRGAVARRFYSEPGPDWQPGNLPPADPER